MVPTTSPPRIPVRIEADGATLKGDLAIPERAAGLAVFAHGSGSSRHSPRNRFVADELRRSGLATLLFDLLTAEEERVDERTRTFRFDIGLLAGRLVRTTDWLTRDDHTGSLDIGLFGASTGAAAALVAAAERPDVVHAVVSRGGRPDLAGAALHRVAAPTLLIVGSHDEPVITMNREAMDRMPPGTSKKLEIIPGATHLFPEEGALERVAELAVAWFTEHLGR
jgi:putative phosphoribosyl transferase